MYLTTYLQLFLDGSFIVYPIDSSRTLSLKIHPQGSIAITFLVPRKIANIAVFWFKGYMCRCYYRCFVLVHGFVPSHAVYERGRMWDEFLNELLRIPNTL